jgi:hypothetical protein
MWRASVLLQDTVPQFQRHPEHEMVDWMNDIQTAITKFLPSACSRVDSIKLVPGTKQSIQAIPAVNCKPGDGTTPADAVVGTMLLDVIRNMGPDGLTPGRSIRVVPRKQLDTMSPDWHTVASTEVASFVYDPATPRYFWVTPGVHASTPVWVDAAFTAQPLKIPNTGTTGAELYRIDGGSTQTITIADEFIDDIVNGVVARANMKPVEWADANKASAFTAMFVSSLNAKVEAITGNNPNLKFLPFAPAPLGAAR